MTDRKYEIFSDPAYFGMWCVRDTISTKFNSRTSWHFMKKEEAEKLLELLEKAL